MGQPSISVYVDYVGTPHTFLKALSHVPVELTVQRV